MSKAGTPKVSIIIPVLYLNRPLNKKRFFIQRYTIENVLEDIAKNVKIENEVIVICNGSDPELIQYISANSKIDKYCINSVNVGVARAWNIGAEMSEAKILCFLNDDVEVGLGALEKLTETLEQNEMIGQVGPVGAIWNGSAHDRFVGETQIEEADAIAGFLFLMKASLYWALGGFDVAYSPAGFEEIDMCFSIRKTGKKCVVVPGLNVKHHHHHGVSAYKSVISYLGKEIDSEALHLRNKDYFERKWFDINSK